MERRHFLLLTVAAAATTPQTAFAGEHPVIAFARDFSGNDPAIVNKVSVWSVLPPWTRETIGFYGAEDESARYRLYLATVTLLAEGGKILPIEDKYTYEIFFKWRDAGLIDLATMPPMAQAVFGPIIDWHFPPEGPELNAFRDVIWAHYAQAAAELEQHMADRGKVLLSVDAPHGDTLFFAAVDPDIADRWRDKALAISNKGYRAGVRSPLWDYFWQNLGYAFGPALIRDELPPGTRVRSEGIPFAQ